MAVGISGVTLCPTDDLITKAWLDYPLTGPVDRYAFDIYGSVVSKEPVAEVEFVHEQSLVASCELTVPRPEAAELYGSSSPRVGFRKAIGTVGLPPSFTIGVRVVFQDGRRREIAEIRGTQQLTSAFTPSMQPIIVTSLGRSGSTWLMGMLAEHPDIIVHERFPYGETLCLQLLDAFHTGASRTRGHLAGGIVEVLEGSKTAASVPLFLSRHGAVQWISNRSAAGTPPIRSRNSPAWRRPPSSRSTTITPARENARHLPSSRRRASSRRASGQATPPGQCGSFTRAAREIFLVRDPRDTLASVLAFNARRGFDDFGRDLVETNEQYVGVIRTRTLSLVQTWKSTSYRGPLVRYEDLMRSPTEQIRAILEALGLDSSANIVDAMVKAGNEVTADVNAHRTSSDGPSSVGRWKRDLEPRLQKICDEAFGELLDELDASSR